MNKLCNCGCGKEVSGPGVKFISGHNSKGLKRDPSIALKRKQTCLKRYGVESTNKLEYVKEKKKQTFIQKYQNECSLQSKEVQEKTKQTCLKKYGFEYAQQSKEIQEKTKQTNLIHNNVEYPMQSKEVQEKSKLTMIQKYGVEYAWQCKEIQEKTKQTCLERYGVEYYSKTTNGRHISRLNLINAIKLGLKDGCIFSPRKGNNEKPFIYELQKHTNYFIDNNSELVGYFPDGYIKELNLVIEYDEIYHNSLYQKKRDFEKNSVYKQNGLVCFRVIEKQWIENKEQVINDFKNLVSQLNEQTQNKEFI